MSKLTDIIEGVAPFYLVIFFGWLAGKRRLLDHSSLQGLNTFLMQMAIPALVFKILAKADLMNADWSGVAADMIYKLSSAGLLVLLYYPKHKWSLSIVEPVVTDHLLLTLPNTFIIGVPLLSTMYPRDRVELYMSMLLVDQALFSFAFAVLCGEAVRFYKQREAGMYGVLPAGVGEGAAAADAPPVKREGEASVGNGQSGPERSADEAGRGEAPAVGNGDVYVEVNGDGGGGGGGGGGRGGGLVPRPAVLGRNFTAAAGLFPRAHRAADLSGGESGGDDEDAGAGGHGHIDMRGVARKIASRLARNPVIHSSVLGTAWSIIGHYGDFALSDVVILETLVDTLGNCVLGVALFNIGLFGYGRPLMAGGAAVAARTLALRFVASPVLMGGLSVAVGMKGDLLKIMIMQAALPQAVVSFVISQDYDLSPAVFQTAIVLGTILSLPVVVGIYFLLETIA